MYTYAFLPSSALSADEASLETIALPAGLMGSLAVISVATVSALVEPELDLEMIQHNDGQLMQAVLNHDRVIRDLFEQTTLLPLRFGTCFVSQAGLIEHLQAQQQNYCRKLKELAGKAEYSLKCRPRQELKAAMAIDSKGTDYFLVKNQRFQPQTELEHLHQLQRAIAQTYRVLSGESQDGVEKLYLLSDRQQEAQLQQQCQQWQAEYPHWQLSLGSALPPYHFV